MKEKNQAMLITYSDSLGKKTERLEVGLNLSQVSPFSLIS